MMMMMMTVMTKVALKSFNISMTNLCLSQIYQDLNLFLSQLYRAFIL